MKTIRAFAGILALFACVSCAGGGLSTPEARPYEVVDVSELETTNGRSARHWHIVSESSTFVEHAQTVARAATDLEREHGMDLTQVSLYPSRTLAASGVRYGHGFYATDGRAGQGLPGADPEYRATWRIYAADELLTDDELAVAELWTECAPDFPSIDPLSSCLVDEGALSAFVSEELGMPGEEARLKHLPLKRWLEIAE